MRCIMKTGELIYNRRKQLNLTLEDVAKYVHVSKSTVKKWETGFIKNMKSDKMALLSEVLQMEPTELFDWPSSHNAKTIIVSTENYSDEEKDLVHRYRELDDRGKRAVQDTIDREMGYVIKEPLFRAAEK